MRRRLKPYLRGWYRLNKKYKKRHILAPALAILIILLMCVSTLAGAVASISVTSGSDNNPASPPDRDLPGEADLGDSELSEIDTGDSAITNELDYATRERLANKILGDEVTSREFNGAVADADMDAFLLNQVGINSLKRSLYLKVNEYIMVNKNKVETEKADPDSTYSSNLYKAVSDYLNSPDRETTYISITDELISKGFTPDREVVEERTETAKVFRNNDGTYTAVLNDRPMHYLDSSGAFSDIDLNIIPDSTGKYGYKVEKNMIKTYFSSGSSEITVDLDGASSFSWTPVSMVYIDRFALSHDIGEVQKSSGEVNGNTIYYEDTFPYTSEEFFVNSDHLKHNLILSELPESAKSGMYLSYIGRIDMADGLALYIDGEKVLDSIETRSTIEVKDSSGELIYTIPAPFAFEYNDMGNCVDGSYSIIFEDEIIYLALNTPVSWLKDPARTYPVVVDPNIYVSITESYGAYAYLYYYYRYTSSPTYTYYYYRPYTYRYIGYYGYVYSSYEYFYTRRSVFAWDTSVIPDTYSVKQIDFHGNQWRNSYAGFTVNVREFPLDPMDYSSSSSSADKQKAYEAMASGRIYNSSVNFPSASSYYDIDIYNIGGTAKTDMQNNLTNDVFYLAMHKTVESSVSTGYGYFYVSNSAYAQIYVTYDPCPTAPIIDTGGPYMIPEGTNGVILDASNSVVCGSSVLYSWDTNEDGLYDLVSTQPKVFWNKNFPDDWSTNVTLQIKDLTYNYVVKETTLFTIFNVNPQIVSPPTPITADEGTTVTIPAIQFTDPGDDTWNYYYDFDGDNKIDKSGSTYESGGKYYVPAATWYFCDDVEFVNLTIEDEDGGYSDNIDQEEVEAEYDGYLTYYKRDYNPSYDYYYKNIYQYDSTSPYLYVYSYASMTSYDYDYRGILKFDTSSLPSTFTPTNVTLTSYLRSVSYPGKMGVNNLSYDPDTSTNEIIYSDSDSSNILEGQDYVNIESSMASSYISMYLNPQDFIDETKSHTSWYGIAFDVFDKTTGTVSGTTTYYLYCYFYGGSYNVLEVTDGTRTYKLSCHTDSSTNRNGMYGYMYKRAINARDDYVRTDTASTLYVRTDYTDSYGGLQSQRSFIKFGEPTVNKSKIVGADASVYLSYIYSGDIYIGVTDLDNDPETSTDISLWNDISSSNVYDDTEWSPSSTGQYHTIPLIDSDYMSKSTSHSDWYGIGFKKNSGSSLYSYMYSSYYPQYIPKLLVDYRVPYKLEVTINNVDPVLDTTNMKVSPETVKEGDEVSISGITYSDKGPCDTHQYRVLVDRGPSDPPIIVVDWTEAKDGKLDFTFEAPDDDPEDLDSDISKDKLKMVLEFRDDDYTPASGETMIVPSYATTPSSGGNTIPWGPGYGTRRYQQFYGSSILGGESQEFIGWGFRYYQSSTWSITYYNLKIYLSHTTKTGLSSTYSQNYGTDRTLVLSSSAYTWTKDEIGQPFTMMKFDKSFKYNGVDNMVMEVSYSDGSPLSTYYFNVDSNSALERLYANSETATTGTVGTSYGLITMFEFNPTPESGIINTTFELEVSNVDPVMSDAGVMLKDMDGNEIDTVYEGQEFVISNLTLVDPAMYYYETEIFEYRIDYGNGTLTPWTTIYAGGPGSDTVVPNGYETSLGSGWNVYPWFSTSARRYQQWYDSTHLGRGMITEIGFRNNAAFSTTYSNLNIYMSHTSATTLSTTFADNYGSDRTLVLSKSSYSYASSLSGSSNPENFAMIKLDKPFGYNGGENLVIEVQWDSISGTTSSMNNAQDDALKRIWANSPTATTGSTDSYGYGCITKFSIAPMSVDYLTLPDIKLEYDDDHPSTGTSSDKFEIGIELRDDDGGYSDATIEITVENVPPTVRPGKILIDGAEPMPEVLIVKDDSIASYGLEGIYINAITALGKNVDIMVSTDSEFTATELAKYDMVIYLLDTYIYYYSSPSSYFTNSEALVLTDYLENYSGRLWFVSNLHYIYLSSNPMPTYLTNFFSMFGIYTPGTYVYYYPYMSMVGTGGWFNDTTEFDITYPPAVSMPYSTYVAVFDVDDGTSELEYQDYTGPTGADMLVHKEHSSWDSKALITGFDLNQITTSTPPPSPGPIPSPRDSAKLPSDDTDPGPVFSEDPDAAAREWLMFEIMTYFGLPEYPVVEINEGQMIELQDWDIIDPAEDSPTETIHFQIDWGDGQMGTYQNATGQDGINILPYTGGDSIIHPNVATNPDSSGNTIPWGPGFGTRRYQQYYAGSQFGSKNGKIIGIGFRYYQTGTWSITYTNLKIYMSHKTTTGLSTTFANNYGTERTLVLNQASYTWTKSVVGQPFSMIYFDTPFSYNGKDHIVLEVSYTTGTPLSSYYFNTYTTTDLARLWASSETATTGSTSSNYGLVTLFEFAKAAPPASPQPWQAFAHRYLDDPLTGDTYEATIHLYDDDLGHGTYTFIMKVKNIKPAIDPQYVMPSIVGYESGSPSVLLPQVPFDDPALQYDPTDPNEIWTYWWDLDNNGMMNNAPDVIGTIPQSYITEIGNHSYGKTPQVQAVVNDDYMNKPIACYILDDDMSLSPNSKPDKIGGSITVLNSAPVVSIDAYMPMEVRWRLTGTQENNLRIAVIQTNPQNPADMVVDEITLERMPGQPKSNPQADGSDAVPLFVKVDPSRKVELEVTFDATADANDVHTKSGPNGAMPVYVYLDFPLEDDYDPAEDSQSSSKGHHWVKEIKFNVNKDDIIATDTTDIGSVLKDKKAFLVGSSYDDSSDDAQFNWLVLSGSAPIPYSRITYYNDGSPAQVNGAFKDTYPSPWDGTAPVTYTDSHAFTYGTGFSIALYTIDDDGGKSNTATFTVL